MTDEFMGFLFKLADHKRLEYDYYPDDEHDWLIKVNDTINSTVLTLDMRYQTYAEGSWSQSVYQAFNSETVQKCSCDSCAKWKMRVFQMCQEVEYAISCLVHKEMKKEMS